MPTLWAWLSWVLIALTPRALPAQTGKTVSDNRQYFSSHSAPLTMAPGCLQLRGHAGAPKSRPLSMLHARHHVQHKLMAEAEVWIRPTGQGGSDVTW